jgi:hypothetical protein
MSFTPSPHCSIFKLLCSSQRILLARWNHHCPLLSQHPWIPFKLLPWLATSCSCLSSQATWEAKIVRIMVQVQPRHKSSQDHIPTEKKVVNSDSHLSSQLWKEGENRIMVQAGLGKKARPYLQNNQTKRAEGMVQAVQHLLRKQEALSTNPVPPMYVCVCVCVCV